MVVILYQHYPNSFFLSFSSQVHLVARAVGLMDWLETSCFESPGSDDQQLVSDDTKPPDIHSLTTYDIRASALNVETQESESVTELKQTKKKSFLSPPYPHTHTRTHTPFFV